MAEYDVLIKNGTIVDGLRLTANCVLEEKTGIRLSGLCRQLTDKPWGGRVQNKADGLAY